MAEEEKIRRILKGIADDAFKMLLVRNPQTVTDGINLCQSYDELRKQRPLTQRSFGPDESLSSLSSGGDDNTLSMRIRQFIREEVARQLSLVSYPPMCEASLRLEALYSSRWPMPFHALANTLLWPLR